MDRISEARLELLHPEVQRRYRALDTMLTSNGVFLRLVQGLRTWPEQAALYAKGRTSAGEPCKHNGVTTPIGSCVAHPWGLTVTNARPGYSWHNFALVFDAAPDDPSLPQWQPDWDETHEAWGALLSAAKSFGFAEGAEWRTFPDTPHFYPVEIPASPDDNVRYAFTNGGVRAVWDLYPQLGASL